MRITAKEWQERARSAEAKQSLLETALDCALLGEIEWIDKQATKQDKAAYKFGVARLTSPNGGLFFIRFDFPCQSPSFTVQLLDQVLSDCQNNPSSEFSRLSVSAREKAQVMRYKLLNPKSEATP